MRVARGAMWGSLANCGGLAIRPPGVGAQPNFHNRLSRVRRLGNPPLRCGSERPLRGVLRKLPAGGLTIRRRLATCPTLRLDKPPPVQNLAPQRL